MEELAKLFEVYEELFEKFKVLETQASDIKEKLKGDKGNAELKAQLEEVQTQLKAAKAEADNAKKVYDEAKAREGEGDTQNNDNGGSTTNNEGENPKAEKRTVVRAKHVLKQKHYFRAGIKLTSEFEEVKVTEEALRRLQADKNIKIEK